MSMIGLGREKYDEYDRLKHNLQKCRIGAMSLQVRRRELRRYEAEIDFDITAQCNEFAAQHVRRCHELLAEALRNDTDPIATLRFFECIHEVAGMLLLNQS